MSDYRRGAENVLQHTAAGTDTNILDARRARVKWEEAGDSFDSPSTSPLSHGVHRGTSMIGETRNDMRPRRHMGVRCEENSPRTSLSGDDQGDRARNNIGEIVPYRTEWAVILRDDPSGQLVLYNAEDKTLAVRRSASRRTSGSPVSGSGICALCRRPYDPSATSSRSNENFMDTNYFRLLAMSRQVLDTQTPPASPNHGHGRSRVRDIGTDGMGVAGSMSSANHVSEGSFNQGYYERFFVEGQKLGRGLRGSVFRCQHVLDGIPLGDYAIKKVAVGDNHTWLARMLKEVHLLGQFHHNNIIDYKHAWLEHHKLTNFGPEIPCLFILMECANGGNLEEYINQGFGEFFGGEQKSRRVQSAKDLAMRERERRRRRRLSLGDSLLSERGPPTSTTGRPNLSGARLLSTDHILSFFLDIVDGLSHLHRHGIIHRDLKPPNLLLNFKYNVDLNEIPTVLLSDFGECEVLTQLTNRSRTGATGTLEFMAPELVKVDKQGQYFPEHSPKADMWSLGILLYYLCFSKLPYQQTEDVDALKEEILRFSKVDFPDEEERGYAEPGVSPRVPQELKDLITVLLKPDAATRPSVDDIVTMFGDRQSRMRSQPLDSQLGSASSPQNPRGSGFSTERMPFFPISPSQSMAKHVSVQDDRWTDEIPAVNKSKIMSAEANDAVGGTSEKGHVRSRSSMASFIAVPFTAPLQERAESSVGDVTASAMSGEEADASFGWSADASIDPQVEETAVFFRRRPRAIANARLASIESLPHSANSRGNVQSQGKRSRIRSVSSGSGAVSSDLSEVWSHWDEDAFTEATPEAVENMALVRRSSLSETSKETCMRRLLPAPEEHRPRGAGASLRKFFAANTASGKAVGLVVAVLMIVSCTAACYPYAPSPAVFYPVLLLALGHLCRPDLFFPLLLPAIHVTFLFVMDKLGAWCGRPSTI